VKSFIELVEYIFSIPDVEKFLSGKLSQDPLEKFFGCVRQSRGTNENPNADKFVNIAQPLRVANSVCADVHTNIERGNCRGQKHKRISLEKEIKEAKPLPKRRCVRTATSKWIIQ